MSYDLFRTGGNSAAAGQRLSGDRDAQQLREAKHKRNEDLGEHFDRLALVTNAMWELLQEAWPGLTTEHLLRKMREIDGRDGMFDNSTHRPPSVYPSASCGAMVPPGQPRCQYCGTELQLPPDPFIF